MSKIDDLTAGEMAIAEQKSGMAITALDNPDSPKMALLTALAWVVMKKEKPNTTYQEAESLKLTDLMKTLGLDEDENENPTTES